MATPNKDTIYIDIDDEITGIIDKVRASDGRILALVLPKRASVFQSIVNMKLLKRSADNAKKHLVLITSEAGLLPLAGAVGLHVAKTLQTKPEIPDAPLFDDREETVEETADLPDALPIAITAGDRSVGELAGLGVATSDGVETLEIDDDEPAEGAAAVAALPKVKKNKKLAVPNFDRFRMLLIAGSVLLIALIVGLYFALTVLPKAAIAITTNASDVNVGLTMNLDTTAKALDLTTATVPAKQVQSQKTSTQSAPATGQKNNGAKATGSVKIALNNCNQDMITIPSGTGVSANGLTYVTQNSITLASVKVGGVCNPPSFSNIYSGDVNITAIKGGTNYNFASGINMTVARGNAYSSTDVKGTSDGNIGGGTDDIVKIVSQSDIDTAKQKITAQDSGVKQDLQAQLNQENYTPISATFVSGTPAITTNVNVGDAADTVNVTQIVTYTLLGVKQSDLKLLVDNDVKKQIDTSKQSILSEGLTDAKYRVTAATDTTAQVAIQTVATAGPDLNIDNIKNESAGKKGGDIKSLLQSSPGVTDVNVKLSPFWVSSVPKKTSKITVTIAKPTVPATKTNANNP